MSQHDPVLNTGREVPPIKLDEKHVEEDVRNALDTIYGKDGVSDQGHDQEQKPKKNITNTKKSKITKTIKLNLSKLRSKKLDENSNISDVSTSTETNTTKTTALDRSEFQDSGSSSDSGSGTGSSGNTNSGTVGGLSEVSNGGVKFAW